MAEMDKKGGGRKRNKSYYMQPNKRQCRRLDAGMRGFLITCNNAEKRAVQEAYNLLNEYADTMYGPEEKPGAENVSDDDDMEAAINKEVASLKDQTTRQRRFQVVDTKTTNCVFIQTTLEKPEELVHKLFSDLRSTRTSKSRFIMKLFPVVGTCHADENKIEKLATELLAPFFVSSKSGTAKDMGENIDKSLDIDKREGCTIAAVPNAEKSDGIHSSPPSSNTSDTTGATTATIPPPVPTYCIIYKVRNNSLSRDVILPAVGRAASAVCPLIRVNFTDPDYVVSVDVLQKYACISVMRDFFRFRKYNVQEAAMADKEKQVQHVDAHTTNVDDVLQVDHVNKSAVSTDGDELASVSSSVDTKNEPSTDCDGLSCNA